MKFLANTTREILFSIELLPELFQGRSEQDFLKEFSDTMFPVHHINDVIEYIADNFTGDKYVPVKFIEGVGRVCHPIDMEQEEDIVAIVYILSDDCNVDAYAEE